MLPDWSCSEFVFLLSYLRLAQRALDLDDESPLLERGGELSPSLPKATQFDAIPCARYVLARFLVLVGRLGCQFERVVRLRALLPVRTWWRRCRGILMRVTLFDVHGGDLRFVEFPVSCSGHTRRSQASGPGSQVPRSAFLAGPERSLRGVLCRGSQTSFGRNRRPRRAR